MKLFLPSLKIPAKKRRHRDVIERLQKDLQDPFLDLECLARDIREEVSERRSINSNLGIQLTALRAY